MTDGNKASTETSPTFLDRLRQEQSELQTRIDRLQMALEGDALNHLSETALYLLRSQLTSMRKYNNILKIRLELLGAR